MRSRLLLSLVLALALPLGAQAFCGFYVAQGGAELFNRKSEVILARDGQHTVLTMAADVKGEVSNFAMVVPVPHVLEREAIRVIDSPIFERLDGYSAPRLVTYNDREPCQPTLSYEMNAMDAQPMAGGGLGRKSGQRKAEATVQVEAEYNIGEYNILLLSSEEAGALATWLKEHDYQLPPGAAEVLTPYINSGMKFFVVKVNLENYEAGEYKNLRPIQLEYDSEDFMLPIRLGMANAAGFQDLIVYAFTREGRVEPTNYPLREIPTNYDIPLSLKDNFGSFYKAVYERAWKRGSKRALMLEYAWDLSGKNFVKCDPCPTQPPSLAELRDAGVFWVQPRRDNRRGADYRGQLHITRLHARYNRHLYPADLQFQVTPNQKQFQGRYIVHHPATKTDCEAGEEYLAKRARREQEWQKNLSFLTGWGQAAPPKEPDRGTAVPVPPADGPMSFFRGLTSWRVWLSLGLIGLLLSVLLVQRLRRRRYGFHAKRL